MEVQFHLIASKALHKNTERGYDHRQPRHRSTIWQPSPMTQLKAPLLIPVKLVLDVFFKFEETWKRKYDGALHVPRLHVLKEIVREVLTVV